MYHALPRKPRTGLFACCAHVVSGHAAAAPPRKLMNLRRRISPSKLSGQHCIGSKEYFNRGSNRHQNGCRSAQPMSLMGQKHALPRRNSNARGLLQRERREDAQALQAAVLTIVYQALDRAG